MGAFVEFQNVNKTYQMGEVNIEALKNVNFTIEKGEFCDWNLRGLPFWCGLDFGYAHDPSAFTWGRLDLEKRELVQNILAQFQKKNFVFRPVQEYLRNHTEENQVIIAPTGSGKTEAALLWLNGEKGFYTLPLQVYSDAI